MITKGKKILKLALISGTVIGFSGVDIAKAEPNGIDIEKLYKTYNNERNAKLSIQGIAEKYELNAIMMITKQKQWNMFGHNAEDLGEDNQENTVTVNPVGKYESKEDLFSKLGANLEEHKANYKKYRESQEKPAEEQTEEDVMMKVEPLDYLAESEISIEYFYDSSRDQLSQLIRVKTPDNVFRCTVIYDHDGLIKNFLEA
ncbi:hypothetical protein P4493_04460 [Bacillus thuringiensis]|uniref:Uncharacterized protein n=3 Tax=Bacillus thuringiensis TaxID=1428 RepID=A0A0B5N8Q5_BACTU|nr:MULTISPECIES: hypothetical protein [Bacillus]EAO56985.1 hypothetical protein RBTH_07728 [Bacillus thuringiensis serovar israelensis ATCC 35646]MEC2534455.1 hypothetical protein [Bacillus cereus]MED1153756.1 hypothetical protein [Bacillus paranthracis]OUB09378.1 hypothetical protein BK708_33185 [Bacillus thuringiensis serovar yunnanensis]AFQ30070.1 hypothetical protein BTF1_29847 [Bacillus thuringiensis HD-789]